MSIGIYLLSYVRIKNNNLLKKTVKEIIWLYILESHEFMKLFHLKTVLNETITKQFLGRFSMIS